jgi:carbonic anhydrase
MKKLNIIIFCSITIFFYSCEKNSEDPEVIDCNDYHWEYDGSSAPDTWSACYSECDGASQSPINIQGAIMDTSLSALNINYENVPIELIYNGHTIDFVYEFGSSLNLNGVEYSLLQFHFHTHSEHSIDNSFSPLEVHLVHRDPVTENLAVIGVLLDEGNENEFLSKFINDLPDNEEFPFNSNEMVNVSDILPENNGYYSYSGSLTTPPCSENVAWFVMKSKMEASESQINKIQDIIKDNFRPLEMLNDREIKSFN